MYPLPSWICLSHVLTHKLSNCESKCMCVSTCTCRQIQDNNDTHQTLLNTYVYIQCTVNVHVLVYIIMCDKLHINAICQTYSWS